MTDFSRSAREIDLENRTRRFVREVVIPFESDPRLAAQGLAPELVRELRAAAKAAGLLTPQVAEEWGGHGLDHR